jgi:flagellin-like hook-associated protein FlgL
MGSMHFGFSLVEKHFAEWTEGKPSWAEAAVIMTLADTQEGHDALHGFRDATYDPRSLDDADARRDWPKGANLPYNPTKRPVWFASADDARKAIAQADTHTNPFDAARSLIGSSQNSARHHGRK